MTASELLEYELAISGKQLGVCLDGVGEADFDVQCSSQGMSARAILEHLGEAYQAFISSANGEKYEWGTFSVADKSSTNLRKIVFDLRAEAVQRALTGNDDEALKHAYDYLVGHDNYHIGQLVLARLAIDPEWDSYSLYS